MGLWLEVELAWLDRAETPCLTFEAALLWAAVESVDSTSDLQYSHPSGWTSGRPFVFLSPSASETLSRWRPQFSVRWEERRGQVEMAQQQAPPAARAPIVVVVDEVSRSTATQCSCRLALASRCSARCTRGCAAPQNPPLWDFAQSLDSEKLADPCGERCGRRRLAPT